MRSFLAPFIVLGLGIILLAGCEFAQRAKEAATTVNPATGTVPVEDIVKAIPKAITLDPIALGEIVYNAVYIILAGLGLVTAGVGVNAYQMKKYKDLRAEGVTDVSLNGPVTTLTVPASAAPAALAAASK